MSVGYLIAVGLLALLAMALLDPYGRKVLAVMAIICGVLVGGGVLLMVQSDRQLAADQAAEQKAADIREKASMERASPSDRAAAAELDAWVKGNDNH